MKNVYFQIRGLLRIRTNLTKNSYIKELPLTDVKLTELDRNDIYTLDETDKAKHKYLTDID